MVVGKAEEEPAPRGEGAKWGGGAEGGGGAAGTNRERATLNGLQVCFGYNGTSGCSRDNPKPNVCKDGNGNHYAHVCNHFDKQKAAFCLQMHPRHKNH